MAKKSFTNLDQHAGASWVDALGVPTQEEKTVQEPPVNEKPKTNAVKPASKVAKPKRKSSGSRKRGGEEPEMKGADSRTAGLKPGETRFSTILDQQQLKKMKILAAMTERPKKELLAEALDAYLEKNWNPAFDKLLKFK